MLDNKLCTEPSSPGKVEHLAVVSTTHHGAVYSSYLKKSFTLSFKHCVTMKGAGGVRLFFYFILMCIIDL